MCAADGSAGRTEEDRPITAPCFLSMYTYLVKVSSDGVPVVQGMLEHGLSSAGTLFKLVPIFPRPAASTGDEPVSVPPPTWDDWASAQGVTGVKHSQTWESLHTLRPASCLLSKGIRYARGMSIRGASQPSTCAR